MFSNFANVLCSSLPPSLINLREVIPAKLIPEVNSPKNNTIPIKSSSEVSLNKQKDILFNNEALFASNPTFNNRLPNGYNYNYSNYNNHNNNNNNTNITVNNNFNSNNSEASLPNSSTFLNSENLVLSKQNRQSFNNLFTESV